MSTLTLRSASTRVELLPEAGGAISRYCSQHAGRSYEWLRPGDADNPAAFPMLPFCSRIRQARFRFAGRTIELAANLAGESHAIHGHGWQRQWLIREHNARSAALEYRHVADAWPWDYLARQLFELDGERLRVTLSVRNDGPGPMPAGIGLHPFFPRSDGARIQAAVGQVWEMDAEVMPVRRWPVAGGLNSATGVTVDARVLDNVFAGWNQQFTVHWPQAPAELSVRAAEVFGHLVVYTPAGADFFCVEPASNVTDAFNMLGRGEAGHGARVLQPGEVLGGAIEFAPRVLASQS